VTGTSPCANQNSGMISLTTYSTDLTIWTSGADTDEWHDDLNWSCKMPTLYRDALVPIVSNNKYPYIDGTSGLVGQTRMLTIDAGTSVTLDGLLQMAGNVTNNGRMDAYLNGPASTGMIEFVSNINFNAYPNNTLDPKTLTGTGVTETQHLKISNGVTFSKPVDVYGQLSFGGSNKSLATGDKLTLKSVSSTISAMVNDRTNGIGTEQNNMISGQVTVERFIDGALGRKWRLVTAPVKGISINQAWQDGMTMNNGSHVITGTGTAATPTQKYGTLITGGGMAGQTPAFTTAAAANAAGFDFWDAIAYAQSSIRYYGGNPDWTLALWQPVTSTRSNSFNANEAYLLFVRGDRSITTTSGGTTLRPKGLLKEDLSHEFTVNAVNSHTLIGNPYAAPLDFHKIYSDAKLGNKTAIQPYFWIWQASLTASWGGYALIRPQATGSDQYEMVPDATATSGPQVAPIISSGQGFFVVPVNKTTNAKIQINQTHKATSNSSIAVFRQLGEKPKKLFVNVYTPGTAGSEDILLDGALAEFEAGSKPKGLSKALQNGENLSVVRAGRDWIVSTTDLPNVDDTVHLRLWNTTPKAYKLRIRSANFAVPGVTAVLVDRFLQKETPLTLGDAITYYDFRVTGDAASKDQHRFLIVFQRTPLPAITLDGVEKRNGVELNWKVPEDLTVARYELERSTDGTTFKALATTAAKRNAAPQQYGHTDVLPAMTNHYRVKMTGITGAVAYSNTVTIELKEASGLTIYPNPVRGTTASLQFTAKPQGRYNIIVYAPTGQQVASQVVQHNGGIATYGVSVGTLASGSYTLEVWHPDNRKEKIRLIITH
ncbi:MAG TPA: T9SS type A sorting domain-containing protein, partial [Flavisolibacter sp.]